MRRLQREERGLILEISYSDIRDPILRDQEERHGELKLKAQTFASVLGIYPRSRRFLVSAHWTMGWAFCGQRSRDIRDLCV